MKLNKLVAMVIAAVVIGAASVASAAVAVAVKTYYWTGSAGDNRWSTPGNWKLNNVACTEEYPNGVGHDAYFDISADVILDTGDATSVTRISAHKSGVVVTIRPETDASYIYFRCNAANSYSGLNSVAGSKIYCYARMIADSRYDPGAYGETHYCGCFTNTSYTSFLGGNNYVFEDRYYTTKEVDFSWGTPASPVKVLFTNNADVVASSQSINFNSGNGTTAEIVQDGPNTQVQASNICIGGNGNYYANGNSYYKLRSGTMKCANLYLGNAGNASSKGGCIYTQEGGTNTVTSSLYLGGNGNCDESVYNLKGGFADFNAISCNNDTQGRYAINQSGGTFGAKYNSEITCPYNFSETSTVKVAANTLTLDRPTFAPGTQFVKEGTGTLKFNGDFKIDGGVWEIKEGEVIANCDIYPTEGSTNVLKIIIHDGAKFSFPSSHYNIFVPVELEYVHASDGTWGMYGWTAGERCGGYLRKVTIKDAAGEADDIIIARNQYQYPLNRTDENKFGGYLYVNYVVNPYRWTGAGDGRSWSDGDNWEGGVAPTYANYECDVDLSAATEINLPNDTMKVHSFAYCPTSGQKTLRINEGAGAQYLYFGNGSYMLSGLVAKDARVEFNCKAMFWHSQIMVGGGTYAFVKYLPKVLSSANLGQVYGTLLVDGCKTTCGYDSGCTYMILGGEKGSSGDGVMIFDGGTDLTGDGYIKTIYVCRTSGYLDGSGYIQRDAKIKTDTLVITRAQGSQDYAYYRVEGGELTATSSIGLSQSTPTTFRGQGRFYMTAGKVTTPKLLTANYNDYYYLYGGDLYLGAGGVYYNRNTSHQAGSAVNSSPTLQMGGVKLHATDNTAIKVATYFGNVGGATVLDSDEYTITFDAASTISGAGDIVKRGSGTLTLAGTNSFTGTITVEAGKVVYSADAVNNSAPTAIVLGAADQLELPEGTDIEVASLIINGVRQTGTVEFGEGSVTVTADSVNRFIGESGSKWSVAANWSQGVPAAGAAIDLSKSLLSGDFEIEVDEDIALESFTYAGAGSGSSLTLTGAGKITVAPVLTNATWSIASGSKLVIENELVLGAAESGAFLRIKGGKVAFKGAISNGAGTETVDATYMIRMEGGEYLACTVDAEVTGVAISMFTTVENSRATEQTIDDTRIPKFIIGTNAVLPFGAGTVTASNCVDFVQQGGTVKLVGNKAFAHANGRVRYTLEEGTLDTGVYSLAAGQVTISKVIYRGKIELTVEGGKIVTAKTTREFLDPMATFTIDGTLTLEQASADTETVITAYVNGEGTIVQKGPGSVYLANANLTDISAITIEAGEFSINDVSALSLKPTTVIDCAKAGVIGLDYDGTLTLNWLYQGGKECLKGLYGEDTAPAKRHPTIIGEGFLEVLNGRLPGTVIFFR